MLVRRSLLLFTSAALALGACSEGEQALYESIETSATEADAIPADAYDEAAMEAVEGDVSAGEIPVSAPKIAYVYTYGFRIDRTELTALQQSHADLCNSLGPQTCQIRQMRSSDTDSNYASGRLEMSVAADRVQEFAAELATLSDKSGGREISSAITGEDLSKQIVDTEARLRSREVLRDRLMQILQTRQGDVSELVEAERSVAQVNQEIDQARNWLAEMRGRVAYSEVNVNYESSGTGPGGFFEPIRESIDAIGPLAGYVIGALILLVTVFGPLALLGWGLWRLVRRLRKRRKQEADPTVEADA